MVSRKSDLIQNYSKGLDLSPEGLRYYERKGIVHPQRDPHTGYRYYAFADTLAVTTCRKMRCWGYTLEEASGILKEQDFTEQNASLKEHEKTLKEELERQKLMLERLEESEAVIAASLDHLEQPQKAEIPDFFFLPTRTEESTIRNRDLLKQINAWNQYQPFPVITLLSDEKQAITGLSVSRKYMQILNLPWQEEISAAAGTSLSLIQTVAEIEAGKYRQKTEEILGQSLGEKRIFVFLLSVSLKADQMKVLCHIFIPD